MKTLLAIVSGFLVATACVAADRDLGFLTSSNNWKNVPTNKKQQGKAIITDCTDVPIPFKWQHGLRSITNTNKNWYFVLYSDEAWVLKRKEQISSNKLAQIRVAWAGYNIFVEWIPHGSFDTTINTNGIEWIPGEHP